MAYKITNICDKCKHEETQDSSYTLEKNGWKKVTVSISQYNKTEKLLCPDCVKSLGLLRENANAELPVETVADKLYACISEIVAEQVAERNN